MTRPPRRRAPTRRASAIAALVLGVLVPAACSAPAASEEPGTPAPKPTAIETAAPPTEAPTAKVPSQSETAWGPIWDAVPDTFPVPDGAAPADPAEGPVSGAWTVPVTSLDAPHLAGFYQAGLDDIGWGTGIDGPLEDGSYAVWSSNGYGCDTLTTILPRGDESLITVLFGAGCAFR